MIRYFSPDSSECSRLQFGRAQHVQRDRQELEADEQQRPCSGRSPAATCPPIEVSSSAWNSPCAASRAASERHASSTVQAPPAIRIRFSASDRSSMRSAPETIDLSAFHCQIVSPSAAPSAARLSAGTALRAHPARAEQAHAAARAPRRPAARSAARAPRSRRAALSGGRWPGGHRVPDVSTARSACRRAGSLREQRRRRERAAHGPAERARAPTTARLAPSLRCGAARAAGRAPGTGSPRRAAPAPRRRAG